MDHRHPQQSNLLLALLGLSVLVCRVLAMNVLFIYDDAFITFRYARNVAHGLGLVYNPGERVLGTTTPAFALLLVPFEALHVNMMLAVPLLNILLDCVVVLVAIRLFLWKQERWTWIVFGGLYALSPMLTRVTLGGMELDFFLLVSLVSIGLFVNNRQYPATILASLAYFVRPESVVLVAVFILFAFMNGGLKRALLLALVALVSVALPLTFAYSYYGHIFSQSILAKSTRAGSSAWEILRKTFAPDPLAIVLLPAVLYGVWSAWKAAELYRMTVLWLCGYLGLYLFGRPYFASWYGEVFYFGSILFATLGVARAVRLSSTHVPLDRIAWVIPIAALGLWGYVAYTESPSAVTAGIHERLQSWCAEHISGPVTITARDVGAIGYFSDAYIYDIDGLVSPQMLQYGGGREALVAPHSDYIYLAGSGVEAQGLPYVPVAQFSAKTRLHGGLMSKGWSAEYILLRRNP